MAVFERKCPKCGGTGTYPGHRGPDTCWPCYGTGKTTVMTGDDKARRDHIRDLGSKLYQAVDARVTAVTFDAAFAGLTRNGDRLDTVVLKAFGRLKDREPARLDKMDASIKGGRIDDVIRHLAAYYYTS